MKVISIDIGDKIRISDDITIINMGAWNSRIRLGLAAPQDINIARHELLLRQKKIEKKPIITYKKKRKYVI